MVAQGDGAVCISKAVADELCNWFEENASRRQRSFKIDWFHLGADIKQSVPSLGMPDDADMVTKKISERISFLMVGTIEPRKGYAQTLSAFELLWSQGIDINLIIVGKQGWMVETIIEEISHHPELNKHLFWLEGISDEYLEEIYAASTCLINASEGEGFGLPLIEAAQHRLPIIARDIPVFREVAGKDAFYFNGLEPKDIANSVQAWLTLYKKGEHPTSDHMSWFTWKQSAEQLLERIGVTELAK